MEDTKKKNLWIWIIVVLIIVVGFIFWSINKKPVEFPGVNNNSVTDNTGDTSLEANIGMEDISVGSVNASSPSVTISYANALIKYKDARLQFDKTCQASPDKMTFKNGALLMIDNRAPVARTVKVGSTFSIKAWGFKIIKLSSATLPTTWLVDCGQSQNVSTVLIQE